MLRNIQGIQDWVLGALVITAAFILGETSRRFVYSLRSINDRFPSFSPLASSIKNLILSFGIKLGVSLFPMGSGFIHRVDQALFVIVVIMVSNFLKQAAFFAIQWGSSHRFLEEPGLSKTPKALNESFVPLLQKILTLLIYMTGFTFILKNFGYDVMSLITALGVGSLAIGLASKETLSNMISGFTLVIDRNLIPGNSVNLSGLTGEVEEIGLRSTRIRLGDGNMLIVPNSELVNTKILNLSLPTHEALSSTSIRVPYSVPFSAVKKIILEVLKEVTNFNPSRPVTIHLSGLNEGYQKISIHFWLHQIKDQGDVLSEFHEKLLVRLNSENIPLVPALPTLNS